MQSLLPKDTLLRTYLKLLRLTVYKEVHLHDKIHYLTLTLGLRSHKMLPLHHVTYSDTKFEVSTSDGLGGDALTKNTLFDC